MIVDREREIFFVPMCDRVKNDQRSRKDSHSRRMFSAGSSKKMGMSENFRAVLVDFFICKVYSLRTVVHLASLQSCIRWP